MGPAHEMLLKSKALLFFTLVCRSQQEMAPKCVYSISILMLGLLIGSIVGGRLGDKFGRKNAMLIASFIIVPATLASGFVPSYGAYAFLRWVICVCIPVVWVNNTVYMLETFTPKA